MSFVCEVMTTRMGCFVEDMVFCRFGICVVVWRKGGGSDIVIYISFGLNPAAARVLLQASFRFRSLPELFDVRSQSDGGGRGWQTMAGRPKNSPAASHTTASSTITSHPPRAAEPRGHRSSFLSGVSSHSITYWSPPSPDR